MRNTKRTLKLIIVAISIGLLNSCGFSDMKEMFEKADKITSVMQNNCDCEEVSMLEYNIENFTTTATYKLVGCEFEEFEEEAQRVNQLLKDSIPNFCDIDHFNLVFVNKGEQKVKSYSKCEEQ